MQGQGSPTGKSVFTVPALARARCGFVPLRAPAARQGYCPPLHCARSLHDRATVLHVVAAIARTTSSLHSVPLRPPPSRRAGCTPFHCAAIVELTCGAKRRAPCGSMVFHQTCLQTPCPRRDSYLRSRGLLNGSLVKNHVVLRTAEHRAAHKSNPGCARSKPGAQTAHRAAFMVCRLCIGWACPTSAQVDALPLSRGNLRPSSFRGIPSGRVPCLFRHFCSAESLCRFLLRVRLVSAAVGAAGSEQVGKKMSVLLLTGCLFCR
ncbi:hypothetical protein ES703_42469 [subsurface metagenome]